METNTRRPNGNSGTGGSNASNERGISPVIGVVLMVAVTVFLAATVGIGVQSFASDVAGGTPQHGFSFETQDDGDVRIESTGGGAIDAEDVTVLVDGSTATMNQSFSGEIKAGSVAEAKDVSSGATVTVRWSDGEDSTVLATWETP